MNRNSAGSESDGVTHAQNLLKPALIALASDNYVQKWKVIFRQNLPGNYYDPNWFPYGSGGWLNDDSPNIDGGVRTGGDNL